MQIIDIDRENTNDVRHFWPWIPTILTLLSKKTRKLSHTIYWFQRKDSPFFSIILYN